MFTSRLSEAKPRSSLICLSDPRRAAVFQAAMSPAMDRYSHQPGHTATTSKTAWSLRERLRDAFCRSVLMRLQRLFAAVTLGRTSLPGGLLILCGRGKVPSNLPGTLVAFSCPRQVERPIGAFGPVSEPTLETNPRFLTESTWESFDERETEVRPIRACPIATSWRYSRISLSMGTGDKGKEMRDATRTRRTRDRARQTWYARWRQQRFARFLGFASGRCLVVSPTAQVRPGSSK